MDEISEKELPEHSSINTISETNKSNLNDISIEIKEIRKKPILHVFTQAPEANTLFFQNMNKNNDKKSENFNKYSIILYKFIDTQYYEDLGSSVVALKYESFLSPFHQALQTDNHRRKSLNKRKEFSLKPIASLPGNHKEDILPINFLPLNSPHINSTTAKKFSKFFKKIDEVNEEENVSQIMINEKKKEIEVSKKSLFEEFFLIGLDKNEFIASNIDEGKVLDGFFPGKILYSFQGDGKTNEDWYFYTIKPQ